MINQLVTNDSLADLRRDLDRLPAYTPIALDTETTGLDPLDSNILGFSLAWKQGEKLRAAYVPLGHTEGVFSKNVEFTKAAGLMEWLFTMPVKLVFHNAPFDVRFCRQLYQDAYLRDFVDTLALARVGCQEATLEKQYRFSLALVDLYEHHVFDDPNVDAVFASSMKRNRTRLKDMTADTVSDYACEDAKMTLLLFEELLPTLKALGSLWKREAEFMRLLMDIEDRGIMLNRVKLQDMRGSFRARLKAMKEEMQSWGLSNPDSRDVVEHWIYDDLGYKPGRSTKSGRRSVDVVTLLSLPRSKQIDTLVQYRQLKKALSSWVGPFLGRLDSQDRIHPQYNAEGTRSSRISCERPNMQAVPLKDRGLVYGSLHDVLTAPPGFHLVQFDYRQADLRVATADAREHRLAQIFGEGGDPYKRLATGMWGEPISSRQRYLAKRTCLAAIYSVGANTLHKAMKADAVKFGLDMDISYQEVDEALHQFRSEFPSFSVASKYCEQYVWRSGGLLPLWTGRKSHLTKWEPRHKAFNRRVQGGVAEMTKQAMLDLDKELSAGYRSGMLLQIHDSIIMEIADDEREEVEKLTKACMELALPEEIRRRTKPPIYMEVEVEEW